MCNQTSMPIVEAVNKYIAKNYLRLHMPGHKGICAPLKADILDNLFKADLTELPGTDDLHAPVEAIAEAEYLAAQLYGAEKTIFLVNGSTQGITSLMMLDLHKKIILPRNAHKALYNGLILSGATPVYIKPRLLKEWGIAQGIDYKHYYSLVEKNMDAAQVWITSPTYFGHTEDIRLVKKFLPEGAKLFVDEAHGAHLKFLGQDDAILQGAHAAVQSWHKTIGSLTQSAVVHFSNRNLVEKVRKTIALTETTSPSYLLLLSMDQARHNMATYGKEILQETVSNINQFILDIGNLDYVKVMPNNDITKISIAVKGLTGFELFDYFMQKGIMAEMAQENFVLIHASLYFKKNDAIKLLHALMDIKIKSKLDEKIYGEIPLMPKVAMLPRDAFYTESIQVSLVEAIGKISTEFVIPYPPGIPVIVPGEVVSVDTVEYINYIKKLGAKFQGPADKEVKSIKVARE